MDDLPFAENSFDMITCFNSLSEQIPRFGRIPQGYLEGLTLKGFREVLRPRGLILLGLDTGTREEVKARHIKERINGLAHPMDVADLKNVKQEVHEYNDEFGEPRFSIVMYGEKD